MKGHPGGSPDVRNTVEKVCDVLTACPDRWPTRTYTCPDG